MVTADIHAELIAAFLGEDEPCYDACQCAACRPWRRRGTRRKAEWGNPGYDRRRSQL